MTNKRTIIIYVYCENTDKQTTQNTLKEWEKYYSEKLNNYNVVCLRQNDHIELIQD